MQLQAAHPEPVSIYALTAQGDCGIYIGATSGSVYLRKAQHMANASAGHGTKVVRWLRKQNERAVDVEVVVLETVPVGGDWQEAERHYIAYWRSITEDVLNERDGGLGDKNFGLVGKAPTQATRDKMRASRLAYLDRTR